MNDEFAPPPNWGKLPEGVRTPEFPLMHNNVKGGGFWFEYDGKSVAVTPSNWPAIRTAINQCMAAIESFSSVAVPTNSKKRIADYAEEAIVTLGRPASAAEITAAMLLKGWVTTSTNRNSSRNTVRQCLLENEHRRFRRVDHGVWDIIGR